MELPKVRQPISGRIGTRSERSESPSLACLEDELATPVFLLENPMDRRAWQATVHGVTKSRM